MSDYGRYGSGTRETRSRERGGRERDDSIFGSDRSRGGSSSGGGGYDRSYRDNQPGGWIGSGATSDYDRGERGERGDYGARNSSGGRGGSDSGGRDRDRGSYGWRSERGGERSGGERQFGRDDWNEDLPHDETSKLIASNKVEGTPVYTRRGDRLGTIYNFMVDKVSGKVEYAVMSYGGFLGIGQRYYPLPWRMLDYDTGEGGYVVNMSERDLEKAPSFGRNDEPRFDKDYGRQVHSWYGLQY